MMPSPRRKRTLLEAAAKPFAANPELRQRLIDIHRAYEQTIDTVSQDTVLRAEFSGAEADELTRSFCEYIEEHRDEITALQVLHQRPYRQRLGYADIRALAEALQSPPRSWTPPRLWDAYRQLDQSRVRGSSRRVMTDIVSLVRYAVGHDDELAPFAEQVEERFRGWLDAQEIAGPGVHWRAAPVAGGHQGPHRRQRQHRARRPSVRSLRPARRHRPRLPSPLRRGTGSAAGGAESRVGGVAGRLSV